MSDGEVAVRQNGHEHAVDAPRLNDQLHVDLDHVEVPRVKLPSEVVVEYHDEDDVEEENLETDGGETVNRTYVEMGGSETISDDLAIWAIIAAGALLVSSGYLFTVESTASGIIAGGSGILLAYLAIPTFWRDET
ncbi:hypothetical protein DJ84_15660 [Halorubrum ezzemoulense]|nr:hypothetical protein DJ84_15660 [Halorubrum ezzemoulense]